MSTKFAPKCPDCGAWLDSGALMRASRFWAWTLNRSITHSVLIAISTPVFLIIQLFSRYDSTYYCWRCSKEFDRARVMTRPD